MGLQLKILFSRHCTSLLLCSSILIALCFIFCFILTCFLAVCIDLHPLFSYHPAKTEQFSVQDFIPASGQREGVSVPADREVHCVLFDLVHIMTVDELLHQCKKRG
jgi:hypothetical protein